MRKEEGPGVIAYDFEVDVTSAGASEAFWFDTVGYDVCSVQTLSPLFGGTDFTSAVISVKKANTRSITAAATAVTTISTSGITSLTTADWIKSRWLVIQCTTPAISSIKIRCVVLFKKLGFSI